MTNLDDPALKDRIEGLRALRDQAKTDSERAQAMLDSSTHQAITPQMVQRFAATARKRMRIDGGGYRRDHLRAFAQRVEVAEREVFIKGSKDELLRTLVAIGGGKSAEMGVPSLYRSGGAGVRRTSRKHRLFSYIYMKSTLIFLPHSFPHFANRPLNYTVFRGMKSGSNHPVSRPRMGQDRTP